MCSFSYITLEEALEIHGKTITHSGGGKRQCLDCSMLESVLFHIQNDDYYPFIEDKFTHLFFSACQFHCFADGNKRLAITLTTFFLLRNGYLFIARDFIIQMENISYHVAAGRIDKDLLKEIMSAILNGDYENNEQLKLKIYNAINTND